jgi:hypothetical protein
MNQVISRVPHPTSLTLGHLLPGRRHWRCRASAINYNLSVWQQTKKKERKIRSFLLFVLAPAVSLPGGAGK